MQNPFVPRTEELLLQNDRDVLELFAGNPFPRTPPKYVRAVLWQYWFSSPQEKRTQGLWWRRRLRDVCAGVDAAAGWRVWGGGSFVERSAIGAS